MIVCLDTNIVIYYLDTNIVIYYVEQHPTWRPKVDARLRSIATAGDTLAVCDAAADLRAK